MSDIKLFRVGADGARELAGTSVALEKTLQTLIERNLETLLGVRFLASEHSTGPAHGGRVDTLGLDENGSPVIIEYKRATNENVINQGLFYLDWLLDHRAEFELLVLRRFGSQAAESIDWRYPRLLCIAGDFTRYDEHAVQQIQRNIELIRYRRYGDDLLLFELVNSPSSEAIKEPERIQALAQSHAIHRPHQRAPTNLAGDTVSDDLAAASPEVQDLYEALKAYLLALGDDVQLKTLRSNFAFRRIKNFACVLIRKRDHLLLVYVNIDPTTVNIEPGFTRDMRGIGHYGSGDLEITVRNQSDVERAQPLLVKSYEAS